MKQDYLQPTFRIAYTPTGPPEGSPGMLLSTGDDQNVNVGMAMIVLSIPQNVNERNGNQPNCQSTKCQSETENRKMT